MSLSVMAAYALITLESRMICTYFKIYNLFIWPGFQTIMLMLTSLEDC